MPLRATRDGHEPMTYVTLSLVALLALETVAWTGALLNLERRHARQRDALIDKLMHLSGRTWTPPPAVENERPREPASYDRSPEQVPEL
jgi:hypothetical protein